MKVAVSYINSIYSKTDTIKKIAECPNADAIHIDLMDGKYVRNTNLIDEYLISLCNISKPLEVHLMTIKPSDYFPKLLLLNPVCIYIHPETEPDPLLAIKYLNAQNIESGIVINPKEAISEYEKYFSSIKRVLLMSVYPGAGGQKFLMSTLKRLEELKSYQKHYNFTIYIDGGINAETVKLVSLADGVVAGSFICMYPDFQKQISKLKN